jgi:hypothetical protein
MNVQLDETLLAQARRAIRRDGLSLGEQIALNLFWRKKVRAAVLAKVFQCSKNTIYYNCLTGDKAREINEIIERIGEQQAWEQNVTEAMIRAVNAVNKELVERKQLSRVA